MFSQLTFRCPACQKNHRWDQQLAGRKVKCTCGAILRVAEEPGERTTLVEYKTLPTAAKAARATVPDQSAATVKGGAAAPGVQPAQDVEPYEMDQPDPPASVMGKLPLPVKSQSAPRPSGPTKPRPCPACGAALSPTAVFCIACGLNLKTGARINTRIDHAT